MTLDELSAKYQSVGLFTDVVVCFHIDYVGGFEMFGACEDWRFGYRVTITHVPQRFEDSLWFSYPRKLDKPIVSEHKNIEVAIADAWKRASVA